MVHAAWVSLVLSKALLLCGIAQYKDLISIGAEGAAEPEGSLSPTDAAELPNTVIRRVELF